MWPNARLWVMGGEQAAGVLVQVKRDQLARAGQSLGADEEAAIRDPILAKYELEGSPYYSTAGLWDDGILDPLDTRGALALGLSAAMNAPVAPPKFGVFRVQLMGVKSLAVSRAAGVERLTLARPDVRKAFNDGMITELPWWAESVIADATVRL